MNQHTEVAKLSSPVMEPVISKPQLILFFSCVIFIAHIFAEPTPDSISENWAGAVLGSPPSGIFNGVQAKWTLPIVSPPPSATGAGTWFSTEWVGIDGNGTCSTALLQAGTKSFVQVDSSGAVATAAYAWYEWVPDAEIAIPSFSVIAGDTVEVSVTAISSTQGKVVLNNLSTGDQVTFFPTAPSPSDSLCGTTVEWIVEDSTHNGLFVPFADSTPVFFQNCMACTTTGATVDLTGATLFDMVQNNTLLATPLVIDSLVLEVYYG